VDGWVGWDLGAGLFYEHRFAMLIRESSLSSPEQENDIKLYFNYETK